MTVRVLPMCMCAAPPSLKLNIRRAATKLEEHSAALIRAQSFYPNTADRSPFAMQSFLRMKTDTILEALQTRVAGEDELWKDVQVIPFIATTDLDSGLSQEKEDNIYAVPCLSEGSDTPYYVVGTLDLNIGPILPAEDLQGIFPKVFLSENARLHRERAYLSNVAVVPAVRRRGVAKSLIESATKYACEHGVKHLYVHVEADNEAAKRLYTTGCNFKVEQEETEGYARLRSRNRRLLLHKPL